MPMLERQKLRSVLDRMMELGASLNHPLEDEARRAIRALDLVLYDEQADRIVEAMLPALRRIADRVFRAARRLERRRRLGPRPQDAL